MTALSKTALLFLMFGIFAASAKADARAAASQPMTLMVDASQASRGIMFSHMTIPVTPGPFTLVYPKWIPGWHAPSGPLNDVAMLRITASGKALAWQRDLVDMYAFHFDVPAGVSSVDVDMDVLLNSTQEKVSSANIAIVNWDRFLIYPSEADAQQVFVKAAIALPAAWDFGTALPVAGRAGKRIDFTTVSLATLVDSPFDCGVYVRHFHLWDSVSASNDLDVFADRPQDLEISPELLRAYHNFVPQALALYGARHWQHYHFLLTLSEQIGIQGIEHHQSSDNREHDDYLTNDDRQLSDGDLLAHEFSHSWNGKYRRPADLTTANYQVPMKTDLLWVYEGLNQYVGDLLSFRTGVHKPDQYPEYLASIYARMDSEPGRQRDPLIDTAVSAPYLGFIASTENPPGADYPSIRRTYDDFYTEGELIWLDADTIIREQSHGAKSLDNFLSAFAGAPDSDPMVKTYTRADVEGLLNQLQPYDWHDFFQHYVYDVTQHPPADELGRAGWTLVYNARPNRFDEAEDNVSHYINEWYSLGLNLDEEGTVRDVRSGSPAWRARMAARSQIVAVNRQQFSKEVLEYALRSAQHDRKPISFLVKQDGWFQTLTLQYTGGQRYPHLARMSQKPDMLAKIMAPKR